VTGPGHLEQYFAARSGDIRMVGPLFVLKFIDATSIGLGLLMPFTPPKEWRRSPRPRI
jgi:hypothetical protein